MTVLRKPVALIFLIAITGSVAACGSDDGSSESSSGVVNASDCEADTLETLTAGKLTIATDDPSFPPYIVDNDPTNGKGFESAVGYAIADTLGFEQADVDWVSVPFNASYKPGPKDFDFDLNQVSITPERSNAVDFSSPYYTANQAVVALKDSDAAGATSLADLADSKIGVQIGTTSLDAVTESIDPSSDPLVFDTSNDVVSSLKQGQVDAVVVDTPTALYLTAVQVPAATVVGQFDAPGGDEWGAVLSKNSPLTDCVSFAVDELADSGELAAIHDEWMSQAAGAPKLD